MIPILFAPDEQGFTSNGLGRLADCRTFEVTEERNGIYEAYFEYPVDGPLFSQLQYGYYVYATHDESKVPQAFEIYSKESDLNGWAKFRAWHVSYQLNDVILKPFTATSCADALSKINANSITGSRFTFWTDKAVSGYFSLDIPKSARELLGGSQGSILDVYGKGDYEFDMFNVKLHVNRGADRGVSIRYGKNLTKLEQDLEGGNIVNGVVPYWQSTDGDVVVLNRAIYGNAVSFDVPLQTQTLAILQTHVPENIYAQYVNLKVRALDLSDQFEDAPTLAQLEAKALQLMSASDDYEVKENIKIDFVALWQTEEYKNYASLQRVYLCDTVHIFYEKLGINAKAKCIKVVYDTLRERYSAMELGEPQTSLGQQVAQLVSDNIMGEVRSLVKGLPDKSYMEQAIDYATQMIQGGLGGYVVIEPDASGHPEEILIMDTPDKATAVNVWRWNMNGLGHSSTGYNGPFSDIALTADGKINADMITTGTMNVGRIGGLIQDTDQTWSIDFTTGQLVIGNISADNINAGTIADDLTTPKNYWNLSTGQFVTKQGTIGDFTINSSGIVGSDGATVYPWKVQVANVNAVTNDREITGLDEQKVYFQKYPNNGSTLVDCGRMSSSISSAGYGSLNIAVGSGNTSGVTLFDASDPNHPYECQLGDTMFMGGIDGGKVRKTVVVGSGKTATIMFDASEFACLMSAAGWVQSGFGYLSFISGYVSGSRLSNTVLKSASQISVGLTSTSNYFTVTNSASVNVTLTFLVMCGEITATSVS